MFNTHAFSQRRNGAGFTEPQVEAMTTGLNEIAMAKVATKDDSRDLENRLVIRIIGANAIVTGFALAAAKLL